MSRLAGPAAVVGAILLAFLLQTTLFGRVRVAGVAPELLMLTLVLLTLRLRNEQVLLLAFTSGLAFDAVSSTAIGLRALAYTTMVYLALRTRDRADFSPFAVALWVGVLTAVGVFVFLLVGTLFSQIAVDGGEAVRRMLLVPLFNLILALALTPLIAHLLEPARRVG